MSNFIVNENIINAKLEILSPTIKLLVKYQNPIQYTTIIKNWIYSDTFDEEFVKPAFRECNPLSNMDDRTKYPYRLFIMKVVSPDSTFKNMQYTIVKNENLEDRIENVNYITEDRLREIPAEVTMALIHQLLLDMTMITTDSSNPTLWICDLYLSRETKEGRHYFHQDSGTSSVSNSQAHGHENVDFLSLLYLSRDDRQPLRGTSIISSNLINGKPQSVLTLGTKCGTKLIIHDSSFYHSTPISSVVPTDTIYPTNIDGVSVVERSIKSKYSQEQVNAIENPGPREFIRSHLLKNPRFRYIDVSQPILLTNPQENIILKTVHNKIETDLSIRARNHSEIDNIFSWISTGNFVVGGNLKTNKIRKKNKKSKKREQHGGSDNVVSIISCKPESFYALSKYKTNFTLEIPIPFY